MIKKIISAIVNAIAILMVLVSIGILTFGAAGGNALEYVSQPDYIESNAFENQAHQTMADVFDYIRLTDIFEEDGKLNLNQIIAQADVNGQNVSYSLDYLIQYGRSMGYYFDTKNQLREGGAATVTKEMDELKHQIVVQYRAYMPNYKQQSPTDGQMSLGTLTKEALSYLARYYAVKSEFDPARTNFYFNVIYQKDQESRVYTNAPSLSEDEIRSLPKYAYTDSSSLEVISDYHDLPQDLIMLLQARSPFGSNCQYRFSTGIDTSFPVQDAFADASQEYNERRENSIIGLTLLILSSVSFIVSLVLLITWTGHGAEQSDRKAHLLPFDHLPVELRMLIGALFGLIAFLVTPVFLSSLENILGVIDNWSFWENCIRFLADYFVALPLTLSIVRSFKAGRLWADSLLNGTAGLIGHYIHAAEKTSPKIFTYMLFVLPNLLAAGMVVTLFVHFFQAQSLRAFLSALGIAIIILAIDCYAWRIATGLSQAVDEQVKAERLKADLITNVSHDLKTPLTSIISYVDLLKRENIDNPNVQAYLKVLDQKSTRLKTLTEDLVEASKASSGNVKIDFAAINYTEIVEQALGEFEDKTSAAKLEMILSYPEHPVMIRADGRHLWRVIENLLNNCCKYALRGSRVYVDVTEDATTGTAACTIKNISSRPLNISPEELTERFVRGDVSRTTEGSGLGLSIAKSLTKLMDGELVISIDGDLYKAAIVLKTAARDTNEG